MIATLIAKVRSLDAHLFAMVVCGFVTALRGCLLGIVLAACGDNRPQPDGSVDVDEACWPLPSHPDGQVTIGTGALVFEPLPAVLPILRGAQSDPFVEINSRIRGIAPGSPINAFDPRNPKTKVGGLVDEIGLRLGYPCPASLGYVESSEPAAFDLVHALKIGFGTSENAEAASGKQIHLKIEVVGANGSYASDEQTVTLGSVSALADVATADAP